MYKYFNSIRTFSQSYTTVATVYHLHVFSLHFDLSGVQSFDACNGNANTWTGNSSYSVARTPYIISQRFSGGGGSNMFRVYTRGMGTR